MSIALLKILSDIYTAIDEGQVAIIALLDVAAAIDSVDHSVLQHLEVSCGFCDKVLAWFRSFVTGRLQSIRVGSSQSVTAPDRFGIPRGSVLGALLYLIFIIHS